MQLFMLNGANANGDFNGAGNFVGMQFCTISLSSLRMTVLEEERSFDWQLL